MRTARRRRGLPHVVTVVLLATVALAAPAAAHPFGPPSQAVVTVDGDVVTVRWSAAEDDWVALGHHLGAFDAASAPTGPDATVPRTGEELLAASSALRTYLREGLAVRQGDEACTGEVAPVRALLDEGVTVAFTCPRPVDVVTLDLRLLTDLDPAYRTAVTIAGAAPARALLTSAAPVVELDRAAAGSSGGALAPVGVGTLAVIALLGVGLVTRRRRIPAAVTP